MRDLKNRIYEMGTQNSCYVAMHISIGGVNIFLICLSFFFTVRYVKLIIWSYTNQNMEPKVIPKIKVLKIDICIFFN